MGVSKILLVITAAGFVACCVAELLHHHRFRHFVSYSVHADVIVGNSDIGTHDMHYARLLNISLIPFRLEGCKFASDVIGVPDSVVPRWDVQKPDAASGRWFSLRGADTLGSWSVWRQLEGGAVQSRDASVGTISKP